MASKAVYGALMGLGEGISGYGKALTTDALRRQADERDYDRQHSLQQIRQQYQNQRQLDSQAFQKQLQQENWDEAERVRQEGFTRDEAGRDPTTRLGALVEAEAERDSARRVNERSAYYGGSSGVLSKINRNNWTPESLAAHLDEKQRLQEDGMSETDASELASVTAPLVRRPESASKAESSASKSINDAVFLFESLDAYEQVERLVGYKGLTRVELEQMSSEQLFNLFMQKINDVEQRLINRNSSGLMNPAISPENRTPPPASPLNNDPIGYWNKQ